VRCPVETSDFAADEERYHDAADLLCVASNSLDEQGTYRNDKTLVPQTLLRMTRLRRSMLLFLGDDGHRRADPSWRPPKTLLRGEQAAT